MDISCAIATATDSPDHVELAERLRELRPWAKENLATYEERRDYFAGLVEESLR